MLAEQHAMDRVAEHGALLRDREGERRDQEQLMLDVLGTATPFGAMTKMNRLIWTKPYKDRGGGFYATEIKDSPLAKNATIRKNDTGGEWKLDIDDEWHNTYRTMGEAKEGLLDFIKQDRLAKTVLPMDEASRMKRAREMGYTVNAYHGTGGDIAEFDPSKMNPSMKLGKGFYFSETPSYANLASSIRHKRARAKGDESQSANVMPVKLKLENPMVFDSENALPVGGRLDMDTLKAMGHDGVILKSNKGNEITVFEPHQIRSKFAKFDLKKPRSGNILAGAGGTAVALPVLSERE
tara:strand:+ start:572 stop:1456 length:885 start_codon:yes stop_codon:yes gene_type:complete